MDDTNYNNNNSNINNGVMSNTIKPERRFKYTNLALMLIVILALIAYIIITNILNNQSIPTNMQLSSSYTANANQISYITKSQLLSIFGNETYNAMVLNKNTAFHYIYILQTQFHIDIPFNGFVNGTSTNYFGKITFNELQFIFNKTQNTTYSNILSQIKSTYTTSIINTSIYNRITYTTIYPKTILSTNEFIILEYYKNTILFSYTISNYSTTQFNALLPKLLSYSSKQIFD
ncbi:MAG: hypothetical protein ACP5M9_01470 [Candidatus Micrarchaeia archaeon]